MRHNRENTATREARILRTLLAHLLIVEHGHIPAASKEREPTADERSVLIWLATRAGGIGALRRWLDDVEHEIKQKRGRPLGSPYAWVDLVVIWAAFKAFRLASPPISKHKAITRAVEDYYPIVTRSLGASKEAAVKRLKTRPWPPDGFPVVDEQGKQVAGFAGMTSPLRPPSL